MSIPEGIASKLASLLRGNHIPVGVFALDHFWGWFEQLQVDKDTAELLTSDLARSESRTQVSDLSLEVEEFKSTPESKLELGDVPQGRWHELEQREKQEEDFVRRKTALRQQPSLTGAGTLLRHYQTPDCNTQDCSHALKHSQHLLPNAAGGRAVTLQRTRAKVTPPKGHNHPAPVPATGLFSPLHQHKNQPQSRGPVLVVKDLQDPQVHLHGSASSSCPGKEPAQRSDLRGGDVTPRETGGAGDVVQPSVPCATERVAELRPLRSGVGVERTPSGAQRQAPTGILEVP